MITLLRLIENNKVVYESLYGSWAGAFGYFQFMPSTITNYALDYNDDNKINLKDNEDAYPSAANYLKKNRLEKKQSMFLSNWIRWKYSKKILKYFCKKITL